MLRVLRRIDSRASHGASRPAGSADLVVSGYIAADETPPLQLEESRSRLDQTLLQECNKE